MVTLPDGWRGALGWATPARFAAALLAPLVAGGALALAGRVAWSELAAARTVTVFAALAALASAAAGGFAAAAGRRRIAGAWAALALALGSGAATLATRMEGESDAGLEEEGPPWRISRAGLAAAPPSLQVLELPASRAEGRVRLVVEGREVVAELGREASPGPGRKLTVRDVFVAPAFEVRRAGGALEGAALVKLVPGQREFFTVGTLPHRFYVTLPDAGGGSIALAGPVHLRVQRGKLRVYEGDLAVGDQARFEGLTIGIREGAPWARTALRSSATGREVLAVALLLAVVFLVARRAGRQRA